MKILAKYIHGSENSTDVDIHYVVDALPSLGECKKFCSSDPNENRNLIVIENGEVVDCYKGTPDEVNNSLLATYQLHIQEYPLLVTHPVKRDLYRKILRGVRIILSHLSRSEYRSEIKVALKSNLSDRLKCLKNINFLKIDFSALNNNMSREDILKTLAFQTAQILALIGNQELYTKNEVSSYLPCFEPYMKREKDSDIVWVVQNMQLMISLIECLKWKENGLMLETPEGTYDILAEKQI